MRKMWIALLVFALVFVATGCQCEHEWQEATCTKPMTCSKCGKKEGKALGHDWFEATCTTPKTCKVCGVTEGEPISHIWIDATCTEPKTCELCGMTEGKRLPHTWMDATCTEPKTCEICGTTVGDPIPHTWKDATCTSPKICLVCGTEEGNPIDHTVAEWTVTKEATCSENGEQSGVCMVCGRMVNELIEKLPHEPSEWEVLKSPTATEKGERTRWCLVCGETLETEEFEAPPEEVEQMFKDSCSQYSYEEISRNPYDYLGEPAYFRGKVVQVMEEEILGVTWCVLRVNVTPTRYTWDDTIYVNYYGYSPSKGRIFEDDIIEMWGTLEGIKTYKSILGATISIPQFNAEYIEIE